MVRAATQDDWITAVPYFTEAITKSPICLMQDIDLQSVIAHLMESASRGGAFIVKEKYLVVYDFYSLWYSPSSPTVHEQLVLNINPAASGSMFDVVRFLVEEKVRLDAKHLLIGDLLVADQEKYGRVLQKLGMQKVNSLYAS